MLGTLSVFLVYTTGIVPVVPCLLSIGTWLEPKNRRIESSALIWGSRPGFDDPTASRSSKLPLSTKPYRSLLGGKWCLVSKVINKLAILILTCSTQF